MEKEEQRIVDDEIELSLSDILDFFVAKWKILFIGAISGIVVALGGTLLLGKYEAEATLVNKSSFDYLMWRGLKRNLPILAARISEAGGNREDFLKVLSREAWWQKSVIPTFSIAKEDAKELFGVSKELQDAESTKIKDFVVRATGSNEEEALKNLSIATSFLRNGAAYLAVKDVITNYQIDFLNSESEIAKKTSTLEIELTYLNERMADLELLKAKFPGNTAATMTQPIDLKDSSAKYLPIITQLIAVNKEISTLKEELSRLNSKREQLLIMNNFLLQAKPVIDKNFDGLSAVAELSKIESGLRKNLQPSDLKKIATLNTIKYDLAQIHTRFTLGLEQPAFVSTRRPHYLKPAAIGLTAGFFFALLGALGSVIWFRYRRQNAV